MDDIELEIEEGVLDFVVEKAIEFSLGARGLRSICEAILIDAMFELPSKDEKHVAITREYAEEKLSNSTISKLKAA
jgi:ATP-dependent Clp protease ATP-binding subunit ClpX